MKMRVKIKHKFLSPLSNQMLEIDSELNVPQNQFWFKRRNDKDVVILKENIEPNKPKPKPKAEPKPKPSNAVSKPKGRN